MSIKSSKPSEQEKFSLRHTALCWELDMWYQYVISGLHNEIQGHTRKDQRSYQRHFCNYYSRLQRFREQYAEYFI